MIQYFRFNNFILNLKIKNWGNLINLYHKLYHKVPLQVHGAKKCCHNLKCDNNNNYFSIDIDIFLNEKDDIIFNKTTFTVKRICHLTFNGDFSINSYFHLSLKLYARKRLIILFVSTLSCDACVPRNQIGDRQVGGLAVNSRTACRDKGWCSNFKSRPLSHVSYCMWRQN